MENSYRLIIAGDIFPADSNKELFERGDIDQLYGKEIVNLFKEADFSIANVEGALTDSLRKQKKAGPVIVQSPSTIKGFTKLGLSAAALANNHVTDAEQGGSADTIKCFEENGIRTVGVGTVRDMKDHISISLGDKKVCFYNVSDSFYNIPTEETIGANIYDEYEVCNRIKELKQTHNYLIVIYHGGAEYFQYSTPLVYKRCHRMADCGADVIVTQHTHCIGCEEIYNDCYILYGQGNFFFARQKRLPEITTKGILLEILINSNGIKINKHLVITKNSTVVRYAEDQDFTDFNERSIKNCDRLWVERAFQEEKVHEIAVPYILAMKGNSLYWKIVKRLFPNRLEKMLFNSYKPKQLLMVQDMLRGTRRNESMLQVFSYIQNKTEHGK